ncbi:sigma-70 family RNA polymerase sigma factor [Roseomonas sp. M0104]|uniref:RNA polymerase sigma factor n=1 Tax=Teichococcus coralli TaxID=2545983 RepID=A0A845B7K0_9PROT|nr:sigma-70 family RNA polymerase sigma factor [Pseudoroseomonas coralli]
MVAVARSQDHGAFAALFAHFAPKLKTYFRKFGMVDGEAEELAQETMILVWRKAPLFDPARSMASTWIYAIARNLRIDAFRRNGAHANEVSAAEPFQTQDDAPDAEMQLTTAAHQALLHKAMHLLPQEQAQVLQLCYFSDRSHSEVARDLGIPLGTVKGRLRLVMARLRRALEE